VFFTVQRRVDAPRHGNPRLLPTAQLAASLTTAGELALGVQCAFGVFEVRGKCAGHEANAQVAFVHSVADDAKQDLSGPNRQEGSFKHPHSYKRTTTRTFTV
jgi:hypothetical protein